MPVGGLAGAAAGPRAGQSVRRARQRRPPRNRPAEQPAAPDRERSRPSARGAARTAAARGRRPAARAAAEQPPPPNPPRRPPPNLDKWNDAHSIPRLKQPSIAWPKLLLIWLLFLIWVKSADWVNRDTQIFDLGYGKWNPILFFPFLAVLLLFTFPVIDWLAELSGSRSSCCRFATWPPICPTS